MGFHPEGVGKDTAAELNRDRKLGRVRAGTARTALVFHDGERVEPASSAEQAGSTHRPARPTGVRGSRAYSWDRYSGQHPHMPPCVPAYRRQLI
jgi:hypothetical protein